MVESPEMGAPMHRARWRAPCVAYCRLDALRTNASGAIDGITLSQNGQQNEKSVMGGVYLGPGIAPGRRDASAAIPRDELFQHAKTGHTSRHFSRPRPILRRTVKPHPKTALWSNGQIADRFRL
ncbi:hypothetical protein HDG32_001511 [Paraburkholderia sp. CI2]|uniref:hypothetical protein n=1 Tax=Paraburkholderia sp. CI2 TaxID=2723093 RepID=UPI0016198AD9|nr:hypothetical protein [Paraburkholderia sp. CI2]MBB5465407.1 hypothetical protein [Paraburkholderia sp. CI2]